MYDKRHYRESLWEIPRPIEGHNEPGRLHERGACRALRRWGHNRADFCFRKLGASELPLTRTLQKAAILPRSLKK